MRERKSYHGIIALAAVLGTVACSSSEPSKSPASSEPDQQISAEAPFTISCSGTNQTFDNDKGIKGALFTFVVTFDGRRRQAFMSDFSALTDGYTQRPMTDMENKLIDITTLDAKRASAGDIVVDRVTGRFDGSASSGSCEKVDLVPLPEPNSKKF